MQKPRRHERVFLLADVAVQPNHARPRRFEATSHNVSRSGVAVFCRHHFAVGEIVGVQMSLPDARGRRRAFTLYGTVRHCRVEPEGCLLGIEFVVGENAGDYAEFAGHVERQAAGRAGAWRGGFTLVEVCIAMTVVCLLATMAVPLYTRAVEQSRLDVASAKLRTVWSAQRIHWLEKRTFAGDLWTLDAMDLLDPSVAGSQTSGRAVYVYQVAAADGSSFQARAVRNGSGVWTGQIEIDQTGRLTGAINGPDGQRIVPTP